jgi:hypothetical protein
MTAIRKILIAASLMISATAAQAAETLKVAPAQLDPAKAYVMVRMGERSPDLWNTLILSPYDEAAEDVRGKGRAKGNPVAKTADRMVVITTKPFIAEEDHVRTYLVSITPGKYVIAGGPTTCFCLGSYQFEAAVGQITDLGTIYIGPENGSSSWAALANLRSSPDIEARAYTVAEAIAIYPWKSGMPVPAALAALPKVPAIYTVAKRFGNHQGQLLNRALPLEASK